MTIRSRLRVWLLLGPAAFVCHIGNASSAIEVIVSVPDQTLALLDQGKLIARYRISTSKFGIGDSSSSYRTPLGTLFVSAKYGDHLPAGSVIKNRAPTGEIVNAMRAAETPSSLALFGCAEWNRKISSRTTVAFTFTARLRSVGSASRPALAVSECVHATSSPFTIESISACTLRSRENRSAIF